MSGQIKGGGPAFPAEGPSAGQFDNPGMTLRDYFAANALAGYVSNQEWLRNAYDATGRDPGYCAAMASYEAADAMIAAREVQS